METCGWHMGREFAKTVPENLMAAGEGNGAECFARRRFSLFRL
jgi:hypothetical protein